MELEDALIEEVEELKVKLKIETETRFRLIKEIAKALGIYIFDDRIELWIDDPEFINAGVTEVYYKHNKTGT
jgi:hypothetical protein